jgi:hypothetical protein
MRRRTRTMLFVAAAAATSWPVPAGASMDGPCRATIDGLDVASRSASDPAAAIDVDEGDVLVVAVESTSPVDDYRIQLEFAGVRWTVAKGAATDDGWRREISVDDYARYGAGLYRIHGVSGGPEPCDGAVLVKVGGNPLTTPLGLVGVAFAGVGAANTLRVARRARRGAR